MSLQLPPGVSLRPDSNTRNLIQSTGDFLTLAVRQQTGQTANLFEAQSTAGSNAQRFRVESNGNPSCPGAGTSSERYGSGSLAAGNDSTAIGSGATSPGEGGCAFGRSAACQANFSVSVGFGSSVTGLFGLGIGQGCVSSGVAATTIGTNSTGAAEASTLIGRNNSTSAAHTGSIVIGFQLVSTAANQLLFGSSSAPRRISEVYVGMGVTNAAPQGFSLNGTGGSGTNIAGATVTIAGGKGTGNAMGGSIKFQSTIAGSSGTTLNTLQDKMILTNVGVLQFWQPSTTADRLALSITPTLPTATDASRTSRTVFSMTDFAATREVMRLEATGTAAAFSVFGVTAAPQQTGGAATAGVTYGATEQTMLQKVYDGMRTFGFLN